MGNTPFHLDAVIIGGGVAGLLTLDALHRRGCHAWLIERTALGAGQTIQSQGIVHGGLKYALGGAAHAAAKAVSEMPDRWRSMLSGEADPNLSAVAMRSEACALWSTGSATSMLGLLGAKLALRSGPEAWPTAIIPEPLKHVRGRILRVAEPVLEPESLLNVLSTLHADRIIRGDTEAIDITSDTPTLKVMTSAGMITITCAQLMLIAGGGNSQLRAMAKLSGGAMQVRPLRMTLARGDLPVLNGHCVKGAKPWLTITTACDQTQGTIWQIGGEAAEWGATASSHDTINRAAAAVAAALPDVSLGNVQWATYEAPRAEQSSSDGGRPDSPGIIDDGSICTAWPTKLALAPILAEQLAQRVTPVHAATPVPQTYERPPVATPPWREVTQWINAHSDTQA
ncbi:MAG: FAD-dependent oxidoreductase [Phycisphaerae bacterium]|nr:FAD-dependent oxidoreductase [Phycisphaerae bacterium]MBT5584114.1 FAD-dependent oxidoreductase [Phycisphaerae bacterium]